MLFSFILLSFFAVTSCDSDPAAPDGSVTMKIDGASWSADVLPNAVYDDVLLNLSIHGVRESDQTSLVIDATNVTGPGTWTLTEGGDGVFFRKFIEEEKYETNAVFTGQLIVTTMNSTRVKGTFFFDAMLEVDSSRVIQVRDGKFDVGYFN